MDIEIVLTLTLIAVVLTVYFALRKKRKALKIGTATPDVPLCLHAEPRHYGQPGCYATSRSGHAHDSAPLYNPGAIVETNAGFSEGLLMGCALNAGQCEAQPVVAEAEINAELPLPRAADWCHPREPASDNGLPSCGADTYGRDS